jgi:hypothetical protein
LRNLPPIALNNRFYSLKIFASSVSCASCVKKNLDFVMRKRGFYMAKVHPLPLTQWNSHATAPVSFSSFLTRTRKPTLEGCKGDVSATCHCATWVSSWGEAEVVYAVAVARGPRCCAWCTKNLCAQPSIHSPASVRLNVCVCMARHREIDSPAHCYFRVI